MQLFILKTTQFSSASFVRGNRSNWDQPNHLPASSHSFLWFSFLVETYFIKRATNHTYKMFIVQIFVLSINRKNIMIKLHKTTSSFSQEPIPHLVCINVKYVMHIANMLSSTCGWMVIISSRISCCWTSFIENNSHVCKLVMISLNNYQFLVGKPPQK